MLVSLTQEQRTYVQEKFQVPVDSLCPGTYWIVSLDAESKMSTDDELRQIKSYGEFKVRTWYREGACRRILSEPLPKDTGHNTTIFRKGSANSRDENAWFCRKMSWSSPVFMPNHTVGGYHPHSLVEVMDLRESIFPEKWADWKTAHPEIFPPRPTIF